jgi:hypothetical protein
MIETLFAQIKMFAEILFPTPHGEGCVVDKNKPTLLFK